MNDTFAIIDGMHRFYALLDIAEELGTEKVRELLMDGDMIIKETGLYGFRGKMVNKGVFTTVMTPDFIITNFFQVDRKAKEWLPITVWGKFLSFLDHQRQWEEKKKGDEHKNCFELEPPYHGMVLDLDLVVPLGSCMIHVV